MADSLAYFALLAVLEAELVDEPVAVEGGERCCCCCMERFLDVRVLPPPALPPFPVPLPRSLDCDLDLLPVRSSSWRAVIRDTDTCFSKEIFRPPSPPPGMIGDDEVLCMALIGTGETLCSTDTLDEMVLLAISSSPPPEKVCCVCGPNRCCDPALEMIAGDSLIDGDCRSKIEWAGFWMT